MSNYSATETCCCGASIKTEAGLESVLRGALSEWRAQHRHEAPKEWPAEEDCPICIRNKEAKLNA